MNAEQKFGLAKIAIIVIAVAIIVFGVVSLVTAKNPSSIKATVDFPFLQFEIDCQFYDEGQENIHSLSRYEC